MKFRVFHRAFDRKYIIQYKGRAHWHTVNSRGGKSNYPQEDMAFLDKGLAVGFCKNLAEESSTLGTVVFETENDA